MGLRVWKTLLLQWVQKCNHIENISCLEESDIKAFFANIQSAVANLANKDSASPTYIASSSGTLQNFLRENYPYFEPQFEEDGRLAHDDYLFVYTLMLHYTCIQTPIPYYQNVCNELPKTMQQCIFVFFEQIVNIPQLTRNCLSQTILTICEEAENQTNLVPSEVSSNGADLTPIDIDAVIGCTNPETPPPAQKKLRSLRDANQMITPPTPKSEMLEQCTRELMGLRAKLKTVEDEKIYLEEQVTEDEQKIKSLCERNKQLSKLKIIPPTESDDEFCANNAVSNEVDNIKRHLQKELNHKDAIIAEQEEQMLELKAACDKVSAKLKVAEKELCIYYTKTNELELHSDGISQMLAVKDEAIACLQRDKLELEQCLKETRDELHKGREVLNSSSDLLDTSLSPGSINTSPETLASSVIDKQLREKEQENETLREQLTSMKAASSLFLEGLLKIHQLDVTYTSNETDTQLLNTIEQSVCLMRDSLEQEQQRLKELQDQFNNQKLQCTQYEKVIQHLRNDADKLSKEFNECRSNLSRSNELLKLRDHQIKEQDQQITEISNQLIEFDNTNRAQEQRIQQQDSDLDKWQKELSDSQRQLQCFFNRIKAQVAQNGSPIPSNTEISFDDVENILLQMSNQLDESKSKLDAKNELLSAQNQIALKMLQNLNDYINHPLEKINPKSENKHLEVLYEQIIQFITKYEHLQIKFNLLQNAHDQTSTKMRQLQLEFDEINIEHENTTKELQNQLLEKSKEHERLTKEWRDQKLHMDYKLESMEVEQKAIQEILDERHSLLRDVKEQCHELQKQLSNKSEECKEIAYDLEVMTRLKASVQSSLSAELEKVKLEEKVKQQELKRQKSLLDNVQAQCDDLKEQLLQKTEACISITQDVKDAEYIQLKFAHELQEMTAMQMSTRQEVKNLDSLLKDMQQQNVELNQRLHGKSRECENLTKLLEAEHVSKDFIQKTLSEEVQALELELKTAKQRESLIKDFQIQCENLQQQLQNKTEECKRLTQELAAETESKACIKNQLDEELQKIELEESVKQQELTQLQNQCTELKEQLVQMSTECKNITQELQIENKAIQNDLVREMQNIQLMETTMQETLKEKENLLQDVRQQCEEVRQQLQNKNRDCDRITQELQEAKESKAAIQNALDKQQQDLQQQKESLLKDFQNKCDQLQEKLQKISEDCERLNTELQDEKKCKDSSQNELDKKQQELQQKESLLNDFQTQYDELQEKLQKKSEDCECLDKELQVEKQCKDALQNDLANEQQNLKDKESLLKDCQTQCVELQEELQKKSEKCEGLTIDLQTEQICKDSLQNELDKKKQELQQKESLLNNFQTQCKELQEKLQKKSEECEWLVTELQTGQDYKDSIQQELNEKKSLLKGFLIQCEELQKELQKKSEDYESLVEELKLAQEFKDTLQNDLDREQQELQQQKESLLVDCQLQINELHEKLAKKSDDCERLSEELQVQQTCKDSLQNEIEKEQQELEEKKSLLKDFQMQANELQEKLQKKSEDCECLVEELKVAQECKDSLQNEHEKDQQELKQKESLFKDFQIQWDQLQDELQKKSDDCERLTVELQEEKKCKECMKTDFDELEHSLLSLSADCERITKGLQVDPKCKGCCQTGLNKQLQLIKLEEKTKQLELREVRKQLKNVKQQLLQKSEECEKIKKEMETEHASKASKQNDLGKEVQRLQLMLDSFKQSEESHATNARNLQDALKEEQLKNLRLEQEQSQQLASKCTVEKELEDVKDTLAQRDEELEKNKIQLTTQGKRLEKTVIKLGEQQAIVSKLQREITQVKLALDEQVKLVNALQNEKEGLQSELRTSKERANRAEEKLSSLEEQCKKITSLEHQHERKIRLEKVRENAADKKIIVSEEENARLRLEIGALNSDIAQQQKQRAELSNQLQLANDTIAKLKREQESNEELQCELTDKLQQALVDYEGIKERETLYQRKLKAIKDELELSLADNIEMRNSHETLLDNMQREHRLLLEQLQSKEHQMELDCQILQAKYRDAKEEIARFDEKLKDQRLEMEGKLEKMKSKMRALYKAEVVRMKEKQERDAAVTQEELDKLTAQNIKYDEHTRSLSAQIVRLNEKILEQQKQHAIVSTKLRHLQEAEKAAAASSPIEEWQPFKRPSAPSSNLGSNLAMEDEEGEVFNNTYLTDLKLGRMPDMTSEELQYRNSLQPPHLKSAYAAQYDLGSQESDLKDGPHSLDDSMSALLSTTGGGNGARKKSMGTHYKRPGPPTPSKNGGRLSFGSSEPPREILRETYDNGCAKTPARFKLFASRFSMGSSGAATGAHSLSRDENSPPKRRLSNMFKRK